MFRYPRSPVVWRTVGLTPREDRERLTNSLAELNQYIPDTHMQYQLDITSLNGRQHPPGQPAVPKKAE